MLRIRKFGENRSGYNARATVGDLQNVGHVIAARATPELVFAKVVPRLDRVAAVSTLEDHAGAAALAKAIVAEVMPRLDRVAAVSTLEDHAGDAALAKAIVAEVDDKAERNVHQLHAGKQLCLVTSTSVSA